MTLKPVGMALPPNPSLLNLEIKMPAISLRTIDKPVKARVGTLDVEITPSPLTVLVKSATGREIQKLVFDDKAGKVSFTVGDGPVLGLGEGGKQPGKRSGPMGAQFDRRGKLDVMRPGWGSGTLGSPQSGRGPRRHRRLGFVRRVALGAGRFARPGQGRLHSHGRGTGH